MKKSAWKVRLLTLLTGVAVLGGNGLWIMELAAGRRDTVLLCCAAAGAAGMLLFLVLQLVLRSVHKKAEKAHREELDAVRAECRQELAAVNIQNRKTIESFRSTLSHSLRMPIAIIQGYAELLAGDMVTNPEVRREYLEKIVQRSQYMTDTMSRHFQDEGAMDSSNLSYGDLDLLGLIRQVSADMQRAATEKGVSIRVLSAEEKLMIRADTYLLNRVVFNLLENSLKYMRRPGTVTIRVQRQKQEVSVTVRDDGMGLAEKETEHIFERSFRGSNHSDCGGSGYGLYLVKQTVEAHGGHVEAQSGLGRGMSITLTIPVHPVQLPAL